MRLDPELARQARAEEMKEILKPRGPGQRTVYKKVPRAKATEAGRKPVKVKWVDINKGDEINK